MDPQNPTGQNSTGQANGANDPMSPVDGFLPPAGVTPAPSYGTPVMPPASSTPASAPDEGVQRLEPIAQRPAMPLTDPQRDEVIKALKDANNVLVTVSANPSVDQLAAAIGFTLVLNKLNKHATAVFSGKVPSTIEFLQPERTLEKNTNSLRDFIIALDKSKADKLRYKIEDKYVKIFITPYHTSINENDLEFSQGDFNVDVVVAIGVKLKEELDDAITAHGRILHDATVMSINNTLPNGELGTINWNLSSAGSLSEIMVGVSEALEGQEKVFDEQIANAFLTGIVAETDRFSNSKTSPVTMEIAGKLMNSGANQQLVATKLSEPAPIPAQKEAVTVAKQPPAQPIAQTPAMPQPVQPPAKPTAAPQTPAAAPVITKAAPATPEKPKESVPKAKTLSDLEQMIAEDEEEQEDDLDKIHIDDEGTLHRLEELKAQEDQKKKDASEKAATEPAISASSPATSTADKGERTLEDIEESVNSPHLNLDKVRDNVADAAKNSVEKPEPIAALGAKPLDEHVEHNEDVTDKVAGPDKGLPPDETAGPSNPTAPPPVPPPIMPPATPPAS